jgi:hypothetical protein
MIRTIAAFLVGSILAVIPAEAQAIGIHRTIAIRRAERQLAIAQAIAASRSVIVAPTVVNHVVRNSAIVVTPAVSVVHSIAPSYVAPVAFSAPVSYGVVPSAVASTAFQASPPVASCAATSFAAPVVPSCPLTTRLVSSYSLPVSGSVGYSGLSAIGFNHAGSVVNSLVSGSRFGITGGGFGFGFSPFGFNTFNPFFGFGFGRGFGFRL